MAFAELAGVAAIGPFMAVVGDITRLQGEGLLAQAYQVSGLETPEQFLFWLGIGVFSGLNMGTALHVASVAAEMKGSLLVVAAGDDISKKDRTRLLVSAWENAGYRIGTVHIAAESDKEISQNHNHEIPLRSGEGKCFDISWFLRNRRIPFIPPTCAYTKELLSNFHLSLEEIYLRVAS